MEPIKLTDEESIFYMDMAKAAKAANKAAKLYEVKYGLFWNTMKKKYGLKGAFAFDKETMSIIEERRNS